MAENYRWRTDRELCQLDATIPLPYSYHEFFDRFLYELEYPGPSYTLAIELNGRHIGECSVFDVNESDNVAEVGIMIGEKDCWGLGYGREAMMLFLNHIFTHSNIWKIKLRTLDWNVRAHRCFQRCGFRPCGAALQGDLRFVIMEIDRDEVIGAANRRR